MHAPGSGAVRRTQAGLRARQLKLEAIMPSRSPESEQWRRSTARTDLPLRGQRRHGHEGVALKA